VHGFCQGWMDRHQTTEEHNCIICRSCYLRVVFPKEIATYGELREYLRKKLETRRVFALEPGNHARSHFRQASGNRKKIIPDEVFGL